VACRRGRARAVGEDAARHVQRDHRARDPRGVRQPTRHRPQPRRRPADAADRGPPCRLHAEPAPVAQGAWWPVGRPRAVRRSPARRRAGTRDRGVHRARVLDDRGHPGHRDGRDLRRGVDPDRGRGPRPPRRGDHRTARHRAARRAPRSSARSASAPRSGRLRRRSPHRPCSRRPAESCPSARSGRCRSRSACTRASIRRTAMSD
jgi:hypothetical protein